MGGREQVKERFLFDGIDMNGTGISVDQGIVFSILVFSNAAISTLSISHFTVPRAKFAPDLFVGEGGEIGGELSARQPFLNFLGI